MTNTVDVTAPPWLADLTFFGFIEIEPFVGSNYELFFNDPDPIGFGGSAIVYAPFPDRATAGLMIAAGDAARFPGTLKLQRLSSTAFSADIEYDPVAVTEAPSWLVIGVALGALAAGRVFLS